MKKILEITVPIVVSLLIGWAVWITTTTFSTKEATAVEQKQVENISKDTAEVKEDVKNLKTEVKDQSKKMQENQVELLKILIDLKKDIRNNGKK